MGKRGKPEITVRGKGRALFAGLTEWAEPMESSGPSPEAPFPGSATQPVEDPSSAGETHGGQEIHPPAREATPSLEPPGAVPPSPPEAGDGFRFLALEAARTASVPLSIPSWSPPPEGRWEPSAASAETVEVDPHAPMRALRIPGLLTPEAQGLIHGSSETAVEPPVEGAPPMERAPATPTLPERPTAPRTHAADEAHLRQLNARIDELYRRIASGAIPDPGTAEQALAWLKQAREALLSPDGYEEAEYYYSLAQTRYAIAHRLWRWAYTYGLFVFVWGVAWLGLYLWALTGGRGYSARVIPPGYEGIWEPIMWGGLGGVCGIFYSLYWHVAIKRDFDRQYVMWYLVQPLLGSMIGMIVYMIVTVGFLTIQGTPTPANPLFMYLLAFIAGFRQRFFLELIDRIVQTFTPNPRSNP